MSEEKVSIFAVSHSVPLTIEQAERLGFVLYGCWPCCDAGASSCTHWLSVLSKRGEVSSDTAFTRLAHYGIFSYRWLTYYMIEG